MQTVKKGCLIIRKFIDDILPSFMLFMLVVLFLVSVLFRYVIRYPLKWTFELQLVCYIYVVMLSVMYATRQNSHIVFSLIYDKMPLPIRAVFRIIGNLIIASAFIIAIKPFWNYVIFTGFNKTPQFKISFTIVFFPVIIMVVTTAIDSLIEIYRSVRAIATSNYPEEGAALAHENMGKQAWESFNEEGESQ